ncbi:MAG TPA: nickel pincer cofactor biosynthesis protein LarB [Candidatus Omnitrophota bacterium]|nr:nickel pincer cofactor biosynthesis protein LarB [Candidatus Omnitrophota bacterium]HPS20960.1 nickel pincer cofactor biosynthesis protein LarB [Candidatus Omnitrophota bacterium]
MEKLLLKKLLKDVARKRIGIAGAMAVLKDLPYEDIGFAKIDTHRDIRRGVPEIVFCRGKHIDHIKGIFQKCVKSSFLMATKADGMVYEEIKNIRRDAVFYEKAGIIFVGKPRKISGKKIAVITAGTSDIAVAEEAAITAELLGNKVDRIYDVGVAGIHRLFHNKKKIQRANVVIVIAGMDGALASVVGGMVDRPVIAVPTSVGYGSSFKGLSALLTMMNACSPGISVVNIDNGFGAGYSASLINKGK